jgi:hypothetical protein
MQDVMWDEEEEEEEEPVIWPTEAEMVAHVQEVHEYAAIGWLGHHDIIAHLQLVAGDKGMGVGGWEIPMPWPLGWGPYHLVWHMADAAALGGGLGGPLEQALLALLASGYV